MEEKEKKKSKIIDVDLSVDLSLKTSIPHAIYLPRLVTSFKTLFFFPNQKHTFLKTINKQFKTQNTFQNTKLLSNVGFIKKHSHLYITSKQFSNQEKKNTF